MTPQEHLPYADPEKGGLELLAPLRVLDLTTSIAGPYATQLLADLGATVLKVEKPGAGDDTRAWGPPFLQDVSLWYLSVNRNKHSLTLDVSQPEGREVLDGLLAQSDVLVLNMVPRVQRKLGLDYDSLTVVVDPISRQVLWIGPGRSRETARAFFEQLPSGVAQRIKAVAIDMTTAYELEIQTHCPQAEIVYDLFHVVAKYGREVIDRVRVDQANQLRQDRPARRVIKSSRWLLLRNRDNLDQQQAVRLDELLQANQPLLTVYVLRDELKRLWFYRRPAWAKQAWHHWCEQAEQSGIAPLNTFAQRLKSYLHGILARCRHRLNTSIVEGINNTIKVIKRRAYGYRDQEYFFLKIRAAFPGNAQ
ncbi:ISL3 family transposase [Achromobacter pulmonis]|uniref:ISL3 family transposase n=1 Tax=Achromobacter pulmonis TaxID=1389932 RepID=UPI001EEE8BAF|nr:ISL3 family transposase [Achromobacter pulmonis]